MGTLTRRHIFIKHTIKTTNRNMYNYIRDKKTKPILIKFLIFLTLIGVICVIVFIPDIIKVNENKKIKYEVIKEIKKPVKFILFKKYFKENRYVMSKGFRKGKREFVKQKCKYRNCFITYNSTLLGAETNFDMVVYSLADMLKYNLTPESRSPHQIYVFRGLLPAESSTICNKNYEKFFNWTWSYKLDSDVLHPFFNILERGTNRIIGPRKNMKWNRDIRESDKFMDLIKKKTKAVAYRTTSCHISGYKEAFTIRELKNELAKYNHSLDIYGPCRNWTCMNQRYQCGVEIDRDYFFQLVLQESSSEDFVSDRIARAMNFATVPLIYSGSNLTNFLPPGSYINAYFFDAKRLAAIIDYLMKTPKKYAYFLDWKNYYYYKLNSIANLCGLCTKLNNYKGERKTYENFRTWWNPNWQEECGN